MVAFDILQAKYLELIYSLLLLIFNFCSCFRLAFISERAKVTKVLMKEL